MLAFLPANCLSAPKKTAWPQAASNVTIQDISTPRRLTIKMNQLASSNQLNPYAIQLCALGRWISAKQWAPAGSGNFSIRLNEHSALVTPAYKDKAELSPQDLALLTWHNTQPNQNPTLSPCTLLHSTIYQLVSSARVVLQTQSVAAIVFSRLMRADQHLFCGYDLQQLFQPETRHQAGVNLPILDANLTWPQLARELEHRQHQLSSAFLVRGQGLYVWADNLEQAKRQLEAWEFLFSCELERLKVSGQL